MRELALGKGSFGILTGPPPDPRTASFEAGNSSHSTSQPSWCRRFYVYQQIIYVEPPAFTPRPWPYLPYAIPLLCKIPSLTSGNRQQHCAYSSSPFPDEFVTSTLVGTSPFTVVMVSLTPPSPAPERRRLTTKQDWEQEFRPQGMQMMQKTQTLSFLGRRSFVPRPLSEATEIFDTDNEDENTDDTSPPRSMGSVRSPPPPDSLLRARLTRSALAGRR
jgi:hypothetical protein